MARIGHKRHATEIASLVESAAYFVEGIWDVAVEETGALLAFNS